VRGVEIGIVLLVLLVWVGAIALFFNRWGKIRMLLPYQPDYKQEQLKVPGTAACAAAVASGNTCNHHADQTCQQCQTMKPPPPKKKTIVRQKRLECTCGASRAMEMGYLSDIESDY
ncbi:hypothetical protein HHI36_008347, partial [Cryptolaemus montrouzieri]